MLRKSEPTEYLQPHAHRTQLLALASGALLLGAFVAGADDKLVGRAVLPASTFAPGPTSGQQLGTNAINGVLPPFPNRQPVQGFSAALNNGDGTFLVMSDNGFGAMENSSDYRLRVYRVRPDFKFHDDDHDNDDDRGHHDDDDDRDRRRGRGDDDGDDHHERRRRGTVSVLGFIELRDPDGRIPFTITEEFSQQRHLTGADFDIESMQRAKDGTLWFGDEFGPFLLHTDATGKVLEAPIPLPDYDNPSQQVRSPQNPFSEEGSAVRVMNAVRHHARVHRNNKAPVFSPYNVMLDDGNSNSVTGFRETVPTGSGLALASSDVFNVGSLQRAGYPVVTWTVNDKLRMLELMRLGVNGIISDRPDLLMEAAYEFDGNTNGMPDFIGADGLIDISKFDAQGHRGGRNLRPENTIPAMEVALDHLMTTLELDCGVAADGVPVLSHDPYIEADKSRRVDGAPYGNADEVLIKDLTSAQIQATFRADRLFRGPSQTNDPALSPVSVAFFGGDASRIYMHPTLQQVFDFVKAYVDYYKTGAGNSHPQAALRSLNAERVRFNIETKLNPRTDSDPKGNVFAARTIGPLPFAQAVANLIVANALTERADIQSFDFRTLLIVQEQYLAIRTVYLFGDFPKFADPMIPGSDDGTNLQDQNGANTPWLAGLYWPYRSTRLTNPFRAPRSGGFEGMALSADRTRLLPLLEKPLAGDPTNRLWIHEFNLASKSYTGARYPYLLEPRGISIGDFVMFNSTQGLIIERDGSQGNLEGFKAIYEITLRGNGNPVRKSLAVDLMNLRDPGRLSLPGQPGDVGLGRHFAFPFETIEDVMVFDDRHIGVLNDNNFPFSVGRHVGSGQPDDNEFIIIKLDRPLGARK